MTPSLPPAWRPWLLRMGLILVLAAGFPARAAVPFYRLTDAGRSVAEGANAQATVLVVVSPGLAAEAYEPLVHALEQEGWDAWTVTLRAAAPWPDENALRFAARKALPRAVAEMRESGTAAPALLGHGLGGLLALDAASHVDPAPPAVVTLGAALEAAPSEALAAWARQPVPLAAHPAPRGNFHGEALAELLWGGPPPPFQLTWGGFVKEYRRWLQEGPPVDLSAVSSPTLVCAGALDRIAPPEAVRLAAHRLPHGRFVRFGMLRFELSDPGHADLLEDPRYARFAARWMTHRTNREAP